MDDELDWLDSGLGTPPQRRWSFRTDASILTLDHAMESGETLVADETGGLYLFDRRGQLAALTRGFQSLSALAMADVGGSAVVAVNETRLCRIDRQLKVEWSVDLPEPIVGVATDPFGNRVAAGLADGRTVIYDAFKRRKGEFTTQRPLRYLEFLTMTPGLLVAGDYGLISRHTLEGMELWSDRSGANVGDLATTGDGGRLYVAGFNHGIRLLDGDGGGRGAWILEGTVNHVHCSYEPGHVVATTLERHLYWLSASGEMKWGANLPDDAAAVRCDPLGTGFLLGFAGGRVLRLDWENGAGASE